MAPGFKSIVRGASGTDFPEVRQNGGFFGFSMAGNDMCHLA